MKTNKIILLLTIIIILTFIFNIEVVMYDISDSAFESIQGHSVKAIHMSGNVIEFPLNINYIDAKLNIDGDIYIAESYHINEVLSNSQLTAYSISFQDKKIDQTHYYISALVTENEERLIKNMQVIIRAENEEDDSVSVDAYYQQFN